MNVVITQGRQLVGPKRWVLAVDVCCRCCLILERLGEKCSGRTHTIGAGLTSSCPTPPPRSRQRVAPAPRRYPISLPGQDPARPRDVSPVPTSPSVLCLLSSSACEESQRGAGRPRLHSFIHSFLKPCCGARRECSRLTPRSLLPSSYVSPTGPCDSSITSPISQWRQSRLGNLLTVTWQVGFKASFRLVWSGLATGPALSAV